MPNKYRAAAPLVMAATANIIKEVNMRTINHTGLYMAGIMLMGGAITLVCENFVLSLAELK